MSMEDTNQGSQPLTDPSSSSPSLERRPSIDEDSAAMTIEFLRARLLSERSVSKAARQRAQQLSKKISELEGRLEAEIQLRKKLEADRLEILSKYRAELSEEYGELFASSFGEGLSRNESHAPNEEEEGSPSSRTDCLHMNESSKRLNHEEANDEEDETDQSGREKGVLSWGRQKVSRREFGHGTDWLGRSLSQKSLTSADGESPQKKWAGKSVRQIRKRESSNVEGESGQFQASEEFDGKSSQPDDVKEQLQCEDERDTEVERVLERQAELIEQFEAEENAQRAWEAKFKEAKALASHKTGTTQSYSATSLETMAKKVQVENLAEDGVIEMERIRIEGAPRCSGKVHPEDCTSNSDEALGGLIQPEIFQRVEYMNGNESEKIASVPIDAVRREASYSSKGLTILEDKLEVIGSAKDIDSSNERYTERGTPEKDGRLNSGESSCSVSKDGLSQLEVLLSTEDTEQRVEDSKAPAVELGKSSKYRKHLSSSFRFAVFPDAEPVTSSSPHMPGFVVYKHEMGKVEEGEVCTEEAFLDSTGASQIMSGFGLSGPPHDESQPRTSTTASVDHHQSMDHLHVSEDQAFPTKEMELQEKSKGEATTQGQENLAAENGAVNHVANPEVANDLINDPNRAEMSMRRPSGLDGEQDLGRQYSDFPYHAETRGLGAGGLQPGLSNHYMDFTSEQHPDMLPLPVVSTDSDGASFGNLASLPGNRSGVPAPVLNVNMYEDTAFWSQRRSIDGSFDRVADVLRALQIAKYQIESADEQATPFTIDKPYRNGYDGREVYYAEPSHLPSVYAAPPQYTSPAPYLSHRGVPPFSPNMPAWGYGAGSSRQLANAPYIPYASRVPDSQSLWPPSPSQGVHSSDVYHYETRHYR